MKAVTRISIIVAFLIGVGISAYIAMMTGPQSQAQKAVEGMGYHAVTYIEKDESGTCGVDNVGFMFAALNSDGQAVLVTACDGCHNINYQGWWAVVK
jgi:hypothetical protein